LRLWLHTIKSFGERRPVAGFSLDKYLI